MPDIRISERNFKRLQSLAVPFTDTSPDDVLNRVLWNPAEPEVNGSAQSESSGEALRRIGPDSPDDLAFTRVRFASFGGVEIGRPNWNKLNRMAHAHAFQDLGSFEELAKVTQANIQQGRNEDYGFHYVPEADFSLQGVAASLAWQHTLQLARKLNVPVRVTIEWMNKEGAAHPGEKAVLEWTPTNS